MTSSLPLWSNGIQQLAAHIKAFDSLVARASARVHLERASRARDAQDWSRMLNALQAIAQLTLGAPLPNEGMRTLVGLMACVLVRGDLRQEVADVVERHAPFLWEADLSHTPHPMAPGVCLSQSSQHMAHSSGVGRCLGTHVSILALAPYAGAHFRERATLAVNDMSPRRMDAHAKRFARAHTLATLEENATLATHCALRQGVALMFGGRDIAKARGLLKRVVVSELTPHETLWYALGMSHSTFWLDRVRAADAIDDLARMLARQRVDGLDATHIQAAVGYLFEREDVDIHRAEEDRLNALIDDAFEGQAKEAMHNALSVRMQLRMHHTQPLQEAQPIMDVLDTQAAHSERWRRSASSFAYLQRFAMQDIPAQDVETIPVRAPEPFLDAAHMALTLLHAVDTDSIADMERALRTLRSRLREDEHFVQHKNRLRPLACAWPKVLSWLHAWSKDEHNDPEHIEVLLEVLDDAMLAWVNIAPEPSYGWWALGTHVLTLGADATARACARRGVESRQPMLDGGKARDHLMGSVVAQVLRDADPVDMQVWLERAASLYSSPAK